MRETSDWLEYSSVGGAQLGLSLHEYETSLRIDLNTSVAFLEDHQPSSDRGGEPLGSSRAVVPADLAVQLREVLDDTDLGGVPRSKRGGSSRSSIRLKRTTDGEVAEAVFSNRDLDVRRGLGSLMQTLDDIVSFVAETPYQAIRLSVQEAPSSAGTAFEVKLKNVGSEVVVLPDLMDLARNSVDHPHHWFGVRIAEYPETPAGFTPPPFNWVRVELVAPSSPASAAKGLSRLEPGRELAFRTGVLRQVAGNERHLVQAMFSSYAGDAVVDGRVVIRGRALSTALRWVPR
ncbi:MAG TPA: hypothetical protein VMG12_27050 [Polyangiaceae bacterium]|nr:hypothetical protein [Polyangiaceae bacterium]